MAVDGEALELCRISDALGDRGWFVYAAASEAVIGGVMLFRGLHVWTAGSATPESRQAWIDALDALDALHPTFVVAGHRIAGGPTDSTAITDTREYLRRFEQIVAAAPDAAAAEQQLPTAYPDAGLRIAAALGTKVAKGELAWG